MDEYLEKLLSQIRSKKARPFIEEEIRGHIEDQIAENLKNGMSRDEARAAAVRDMGDPVQAGISLDAVHKPQTAWGLLAFVALISGIGIFLQMEISRQLGDNTSYMDGTQYVFFVMTGIVLMSIVQYVDYTRIAAYAKWIGAAILLVGLYAVLFGSAVNGSLYYITIGSYHISSPFLGFIYVPLYGAILYQYYGQGYRGLLKSLIWMLLPVWILGRANSISMTFSFAICLSVVLTLAVAKGWFKVSKWKVLTALWSVVLLLPILGLFLLYKLQMLAPYRTMRLKAFATGGGEAGYVTAALRESYQSLTWIGAMDQQAGTKLPDLNADYIFTYLWSEYGILAGILFCCLLGILLVLVFGAALHQKNELGFMMGCGCGTVFLTQIGLNIMINLGLFPACATSLPFLSAGGGNILLSYTLMGIVLSIYRYKNIYPRFFGRRAVSSLLR